MLCVRSPATTSVAFFFILFSCNLSLVTSTCYYPNGDTSDDLPCDPSGDASVCCAEGFYCLTNGLCQDNRYQNPLRLERGACNNQTWPSPACPDFCKSVWPQGDQATFYCGDGKYCCTDDGCCDDAGTTFLTLGVPVIYATALQGGDPSTKTATETIQETPEATSISATASETTAVQMQTSMSNSNAASSTPASRASTATSSPSQQLAVSPSAASAHSSESSHATAIGVGVGVAGGVVILGLVCLIFFLRARRRNASRLQSSPVEIDGNSRNEIDGASGNGRLRNKLPWSHSKARMNKLVAELPAESKPVELDAGDGKLARREMGGASIGRADGERGAIKEQFDRPAG